MDALAKHTSQPHLSSADLRGFGDRFGMDNHCPHTGNSLASTQLLHGQVQQF